MDGESIISWTPANMITVVLMVALGFAALGAATRVYKQLSAKKAS